VRVNLSLAESFVPLILWIISYHVDTYMLIEKN
jgi:hypothetical protein